MAETPEPFRLETPRLVLRDWAPGDFGRFVEVTNTPAVMRWLGGVMDAPRLDALESRLMAFQATLGHTFWVVERKRDGGHLSDELLGFCGLKKIDAEGALFQGEFEIGWRLRQDAWGRGYAKEAARASLEAGFGRFGAQEIFAITNVENAASWGLMERLGMRRRSELDFVDPRFDPPVCDTIVYAIERDILLSKCSANCA
ncbi:GNAT family N-acetyltransferase [Novosphingobium album (ex Hu et al. 2023)]|uniref:GNAT family N-acetyltransferase n=1 Tax=Novosphingobium album (ex Hu et al. 2023) TaxID=2930093 RepID=A0ABT0B4G3_9SPHN|nr:GNAT family N-acetyltransferase [Novosphingobium album (ex Hu et al. 2023)]MCJ2179929.1 GNAT family N-acetyltransferase [Novosphingobium album (ex Hu et al. 2023)]